MPQQKVTMTHPKLKDQPITVAASAVKVHEAAGWKVAAKSQQPDETEAAAPPATPGEPSKP